MILVLLLFLGASLPLFAQERTDDVLLFAYFRDNGQAGIFLAQSEDGITFAPLNEERPIFTPPTWPGQNLTRDPSIL